MRAARRPSFIHDESRFTMTQNALLKVLLGCLLLGLMACGEGAKLDVQLLRAVGGSGAASDDPFQGVSKIQFRVFDADTKEIVLDASASFASGTADLSDLPTGQPLKIRATAYDATGSVVSWGESTRFELPEGSSSETVAVSITLRKVDTWAPLMRLESARTVIATLNKQRAAHTATLLNDGRVVIVGGFQNSESAPSYVASIEILDPASGESTRVDGEEARRAFHTAVQLQDGTVLVTGGESATLHASGATTPYTRDDNLIFDLDALSWSTSANIPRLTQARARHQAVLLGDGSVLFFGGLSDVNGALATPGDTVYRPKERRFLDGDEPGRVGHAMVSLKEGQFQVVSGGQLADGTLAEDMPVFDATGAFQLTHSVSPRLHPGLIAYDIGVFALGGFDESGTPLSTTKFTPILGGEGPGDVSSNLSEARGQLCAVALKDGSILAAGGRTTQGATNATDLFRAASNGLSASYVGDMSTPRYLHTCTLLDNGMLLVVGGIDASGQATQSIEIFTPKPSDYPEWQ